MMNRPFQPRSFAPVKVGDVVDLKIEAVGEKGDGIGKIKGFVIFVPGVKEGEDVKVKITKVLKKVGFGEVVDGDTATTTDAGQDDGQEAAYDDGQEQAEEEPQSHSEDDAEEPKDSESF